MMKPLKLISVFLVDDDKIFAATLKHQLKQMFPGRISIQTFPTGEECLRSFDINPPDIVILDYFLNSKYYDAMNGFQVLQKLMQIRPETKVIILSSQDKIEVAIDSIKHGACDYIVKNDNVFLCTKLAIAKAANIISVSKSWKRLKLQAKILIGLILLISAAVYAAT